MEHIQPGDIISHSAMCVAEGGIMLQRGMNYASNGRPSIILMSQRKGAPYHDWIEGTGTILIYEGHDLKKNEAEIPKNESQPMRTRTGRLTENGKFFESVQRYKANEQSAELVKVYEKIKDGIWVYNGVFELQDAWIESDGKRDVFKFKFRITDLSIDQKETQSKSIDDLEHNRMIPSSVKVEVWKRDGGKCVTCGSKDNLHFDHILAYSLGGTSILAENIQLLCARHNLQKSNKII